MIRIGSAGANQRGPVAIARRIRSIIRREIGSRYTGDKLGYLWAYIFPLSWMLVIYGAFVVFGRTSPIDTDIASFLMSGVLPYQGARFAINASIRTRVAYRHIIVLPNVSLPLIVFSIYLLELANSFVIFGLLLLANFVFTGRIDLYDPLLAAWGLLLAVGCGGAFGYLIVSTSWISTAIAKAAPIVLRPLFYVSGVFYVANELPPRLLDFVSWNPLIHAIEIVREGMFSGYHSFIASSWPPVAFITGAVAIGTFAGRLQNSPMAALVSFDEAIA